MANYLVLTLDTTPPEVEMLIPNYTTRSSKTEIRVTSSETLLEWQEVYAIDSQGTRHDLTLGYQGDELVGQVIFEGFSLGIATIYARVMDDVGNLSAIVSKSINIVASETLSISISESTSDIIIKNGNLYDVIVKDGVTYKLIIQDKTSNEVTSNDETANIVLINSKEVQ